MISIDIMKEPYLDSTEATSPPSFSAPSFQWIENDLHPEPPRRSNFLTEGLALVRGGLTQEYLQSFTSRQWKSVLSWAAFHPDEVSVLVDSHGQTALHHACLFRAPATVVEALLYAAAELASIKNDVGELALHWAVRLAAPNEVLSHLLKAHPRSAFVADSIGQTPLSLLFDSHKESPNKILRISGPRKTMSTVPWKQMVLFIRAFCSATSSASKGVEFRPLHSVCACPCPLAVFQFVVDMCKDTVRDRNEFGRLPLAIAASSTWKNDCSGRAQIEELLNLYREAAGIPDGRGRLPLNLAIESGKSWEGGVKLLLDAEPRSLSSRDPQTRLYPFMVAAAKRPHHRQNDGLSGTDVSFLDVGYRLLCEDPSLL